MNKMHKKVFLKNCLANSFLILLHIVLFFFTYGCSDEKNVSSNDKQNHNYDNYAFNLIACTDRMECQDGIWCNGIEYCGCFGGICGRCLPGFPPVCDDNNPCTVDNCVNDYIGKAGSPGVPGEFGTGHCSHQSICTYCMVDADCDDRNVCTNDLCVNNICQNTPQNCDDSDFCTIDSCDSVQGCIHERIPLCCHTDSDCDDGYQCTSDRCNTVTHSCVYSATPGVSCSYPDKCFDPGVCRADGICYPGPQNVPVNDICSGAVNISLSNIGEACVEGSTMCARHHYSSTCGGGGANDVVYRFTFDVGTSYQLYAYNVVLDADFNSVLYAQMTCGNASTQIACNDNCTSTTLLNCDDYGLGRLDSAIVIPPMPVGNGKTVYLGVDGVGGAKGQFQLRIYRVAHKNNPCIYESDSIRRINATNGGEFRGNLNGYINDMQDASYRWLKTPCHSSSINAGSDWPGHAWFILKPSATTNYCVWTDEATPAVWADTVISVWDNTNPSGTGCSGLKTYKSCAYLAGRNGAGNPTKLSITVPGGSTYMVGISTFSRPTSGNYIVHFDIGSCP